RSAPATVARPAVGVSSVVSIRRGVVLPAPFGPRNPTISPSSTVRPTPRTASVACFRLRNVRARPSASTTAMLASFLSPFLPSTFLDGLVLASTVLVVLVVRQAGQDRGELVVPPDLGLNAQLATAHRGRLQLGHVALGQQVLALGPEPPAEQGKQ